MAIEYINIKQIMDDILADPLMKELSLERAVNYAVIFIKKIGMPAVFEEKVADIEIKNYRGVLPCDFYEMTQVKDGKQPALVYSSASFEPTALTYKLQNNVIFTSVENTTLTIAYKAIKVDKDGYPLIVDNGSFAEALKLFITKEWYSLLFRRNLVSQNVLQDIKQEYAWAVGQASNDLLRPSLDQMESITNMWNTLIPSRKQHANAFKDLQNPEILNI